MRRPGALELILLALATWRVSYALVEEDGPGHVFTRLRASAGVYAVGEVGFWAGLLSCVYCTSIWVATSLYALSPLRFVHWILAASAGAILVNRAIDRR